MDAHTTLEPYGNVTVLPGITMLTWKFNFMMHAQASIGPYIARPNLIPDLINTPTPSECKRALQPGFRTYASYGRLDCMIHAYVRTFKCTPQYVKSVTQAATYN